MNLFDLKAKVREAFPNMEGMNARVEYWKHTTCESLMFHVSVNLPNGVYHTSEYNCLSCEAAFDSLLKVAGRHPSQFAAMQAGNEEFARQGFQKDEVKA